MPSRLRQVENQGRTVYWRRSTMSHGTQLSSISEILTKTYWVTRVIWLWSKWGVPKNNWCVWCIFSSIPWSYWGGGTQPGLLSGLKVKNFEGHKKDGAFITRMVLWGYVYAMFTGFVVGWNVARLETLDLDGFSHFVQWFSHYKLQLRRKKKTGYSHQTPWVLTKICAYECKASMMYCVLILNFLILLVFFWRLIKLITWLWLATRLPPITSHHNY